MIKADVLVANKNWQKYIRAPNLYIDKKLKVFSKKTNLFKQNSCNFSILLSGDSGVKKLNIKFRKKNKTTDILSFPFHEKKVLNSLLRKKKKKIYLGDIIINLNKVLSKPKLDFSEEKFNKLWIHGFLHLLGFKHKINTDYSKMKKLENKFLNLIS